MTRGLDSGFCPTERSEENSGGDKESKHQTNHDDAGHDRTETPPAHHQEDPAHNADHHRHGQTDCGETNTEQSEGVLQCGENVGDTKFRHFLTLHIAALTVLNSNDLLKPANDQSGGKKKKKTLTVIVQICSPCDQHKEEKRCEAKSHAKQLCMAEGQKQRIKSFL